MIKDIVLKRNSNLWILPRQRIFVGDRSGLKKVCLLDFRFKLNEPLYLDGLSGRFLKRVVNFHRVLYQRMTDRVRLSGELEINHLVRTFNMMRHDKICDEALLLAGLGHDAIEDGYLTYSEVSELVGKEAADLIEGETKLSKEIESKRRELGSLVKWIEAAYRDLRIIILKAYDNLDNWRDQEVFLKIPGKEDRPFHHAEEAIFIYGPILRYALGFWKMWVEIEDKALVYFDPRYSENINLYRLSVSSCFQEIREIAVRIQGELERAGVKATVKARVKYYSEVFDKARKKGLQVKSLLKSAPLFPHYISVVVDGDTVECNRARGVVDEFGRKSRLFAPEPWGLNNLIQPRENGYRALHTYVSLPGKGIFMIGYTTEEFDLENKYGILAKGMKEGFQNAWARVNPESLTRLWEMAREKGILTAKQIRDRIPEIVSTIVVYSPDGQPSRIQGNATVLDYVAINKHFAVERVFVNGAKVNLNYSLRYGDTVEVIEGEREKVSPLWLLNVRTHEAARIIRDFLRRLPEREIINLGISAINFMLSGVFLQWGDIKDSSQVSFVLKEIFEKYGDKILALEKEGFLRLERKETLDPNSFVKLVGCGEIDVEEFLNKFIDVYQSSLRIRKEKKETWTLAILFMLEQDRIGLQQEFSSALKQIGMNIIKDQTTVNPDGTATLAYAFDVYSSLEQRQILNIVRSLGGRVLDSKPIKGTPAIEFNLMEWLKERGIKI